MNKYLVMYTYYDGDMSTLYSVDDEAGYQSYESAEQAVEAAIEYLLEYIPCEGEIQDIEGNWLYYTDDCGRDRAVQIRVYDEDLQEMDIR